MTKPELEAIYQRKRAATEKLDSFPTFRKRNFEQELAYSLAWDERYAANLAWEKAVAEYSQQGGTV